MFGFDDAAAIVGGGAMGIGESLFQDRLNTRAAREQRDWESEMYGKRYQMQVNDLQKAGLNPMLAYGTGPGSAPSGAQASVSKPDFSPRVNETRMVTAQTAKTNQETQNLKKENQNLTVLWHKLDMEVERIGAEIKEIDQRRKTGRATEEQVKHQTELIDRQKELVQMQKELATQERNIKRPEEVASGTAAAEGAAHVSRVLKPLIDAINNALGRK